MALGDGIRRNIAFVSDIERDRFMQAILKMDTVKMFPDGVTYWDKQESIHKNGHENGLGVHGGIEFIPWHRALCNHFEDLLREVDPELSLHYWDWTTDPRVASGGGAALFTNTFMDNANAEVSHLLVNFESTEDAELGNGHTKVWRNVGASAAKADGTPNLPNDIDMFNGANNFATIADRLTDAHDSTAHSYIGGTILQAHYSFHDPFVFLLHSNLDRLWAKWQTDPTHPERLTVAGVYSGVSAANLSELTNDNVNPWAGETGLEPWASDPTKKVLVKYTDLSIIIPSCFDTNQSNFIVAESENPLNNVTNRNRIVFNSVPEDETTWRAAVLKVYSCTNATFRVKAGTEPASPFSIVFPPSGQAVAHHDSHSTSGFSEVRIWFAFTAGAVGTAPQLFGPINTVIECVENGQIFNFELVADTIHRKTVAVQLVLDQSGSMSDPAGTSGLTRLQVLKDAATLFANLIQKNNGIGIIRFDDNAYSPNDPTFGALSITKINSDLFTDLTKNNARNQIALHGAHGNTSVGDGIEMGATQLNNIPVGQYDDKAMIVLTDGLQNTPKSIEEVASSINNKTFAIGLGTETQVNTLELNNISQGSGGYLLLSGLTTSSIDDSFRLQKFFMQILANVTNTQIVKDPSGYLNIGNKVKIPFQLCNADIECRVIMLVQHPFVKLSIETPDGQIIDSANAASYNATFDSFNQETVTCSFKLPVLKDATNNHGGMWNAVLEIDEEIYKKILSSKDNISDSTGMVRSSQNIKIKGSKYCVSVHSYSNLKMQVRLDQSGMEPGNKMTLKAILSEYDIPIKRANVSAQITNPDQTVTTLKLDKTETNSYSGSIMANLSGVYHFHILANGVDYKGKSFEREQILTGVVSIGGNTPKGTGSGGIKGGSCDIEKCCGKMTKILWFALIILFLILLTLLFKS
jgi:Mg-chelatase subunit ChlD